MEHSATVIKVDGSKNELDHRPTLEEAQEIVGGYTELVGARSRTGKVVTLVVNEDGRLVGLLYNETATAEYGMSIPCGLIFGNIIVLTGWRTVG